LIFDELTYPWIAMLTNMFKETIEVDQQNSYPINLILIHKATLASKKDS